MRLIPLLLLTACFGSGETPFDDGVEPLESMVVDPPADLAEDFVLHLEEGEDYTWGHLRGYIHGPLPQVWQSFQDDDVVVNRRRVAEWEARRDVETGFDFSMALDVLVEDIIDVEYTVTWRHGAIGEVEDPDKVSMRWQKTEGSTLIDLLEGSVLLLPTEDPDITEVQMIEHLKAPLTSPEEIEELLGDVWADARDRTHGRPLQTFDE